MTETEALTLEDVLRAGRTLFGPAFSAESGAWRDTLKATYRRRALETHPDRARSLGRAEAELLREFRGVAEAYRVLSCYRAPGAPPGAASVRARPRPAGGRAPVARARAAADPARGAPRASAWAGDAPPRGELPRRTLRFAEYLYYSGRIRWTDLVEAIAWQRGQRPPVGRIAVEFGFLTRDEVGMVLEARRAAGARDVAFGEWAVRQGYLTPFQLLAVLGRQLRRQRRIGEFFVERGLISSADVDVVRQAVLRHNARHLR